MYNSEKLYISKTSIPEEEATMIDVKIENSAAVEEAVNVLGKREENNPNLSR